MSGIYIHIPFCKKKCEYCDFYSLIDFVQLDGFDKLIEKEISIRKDFISDKRIGSIYFGGGTPSLLSANQIENIFTHISSLFDLSSQLEVTLEANPDDLSFEYLKELISIGINRLSIGVQSFSDKDLQQLGRRHSAQQALEAIILAERVGFENISIDLIYGLPYSSSKVWKDNLQKSFELPIKHLSCYHLIFEEGTPFYKKLMQGKILAVSESQSVNQFQLLQQMAKHNGFVHYEISNLAKEGYYSYHNSSYWKLTPYLGLGPSAHSFNGKSREWNPKSISHWAAGVKSGISSVQREVLTSKDLLNDYLLTSLRTIWGINMELITERFGSTPANSILKIAKKYIAKGVMSSHGSCLAINSDHFFTSDNIISDFITI